MRQKRPRRQRREEAPKIWNPITELGKSIKSEKIDSIDTIWARGQVIKEPEIIDFFLPGIEERILKIGKGKRPFRWVQRMTDSGRRSKYVVAAAVGNKDGYVGAGVGRAKDYGTAISSAIRKAKLNIIRVDRGCGSWDCGCNEEHSIATEVDGKCGSVLIKLKPAPQGTGLAVSDTSKDLLELAGISDVWSMSRGHTATRTNTALATFDALKNLSQVKLLKERKRKKRVAPKVEAKSEKSTGAKEEKTEKKSETKPTTPVKEVKK
jgi:small subunit ribosomal protein S5